ncbi:MAG: GNAT family N-acetyltransferase [Anaerolineae bacterium]|nr:GNAT family N-acetyltransferase [Anaerolineae bacterium]
MTHLPKNLLVGEKVRLDGLRLDDLPAILRWQRDVVFMRLFDAQPAYPKTEQGLREWFEEQNKSNEAFLFGIRLIETDALIGYIELDGILWPHRVGWLSIGIGEPEYWGQGYGHEAMQLTLAYAFQELNLHRVQLTVFSYNPRAIAMYEKLGFRREGTFREFMERDGQRHDMHLYGLLRPEWQGE